MRTFRKNGKERQGVEDPEVGPVNGMPLFVTWEMEDP
jgi:hypothetical protein